MVPYACPVLEACLERYTNRSDADAIQLQLSHAVTAADMLPVYDRVIPLVEAAMWASDLAADDVAACQALFGERLDPGDQLRQELAAVGELFQHRVCFGQRFFPFSMSTQGA